MSKTPAISFAKLDVPMKGALIVLQAEDAAYGGIIEATGLGTRVERAAQVAEFRAKQGKTLEILAPGESELDRIIVVGAGKVEQLNEQAWMNLGGSVAAQFRNATEASVALELGERSVSAEEAASFAAGILLRAYTFDKYKTKKDEDDTKKKDRQTKVTILCADPAAAKKAFADAEAVVSGVVLARNLVNEPANALGPEEFAAEAEKLEKLGLKVEILTEKEMKKLGMGALLGVAQGSPRPPRLVVMQWNGAKKEKPVAFVGKGVVFDTGGVSIKPAAGMEDMKGDMGGAAAVTGLMCALAGRKAKVNAIGIIGCVENAVDGNAQRPGDIVTSMSGQTIEVINTDAEGRLVLADALTYTIERFEPQFVVNLATLTGAIIIALGNARAGLFSNNDELAARLHAAGEVTEEKLWRLPLAREYDKLIDSKFADMKNTGGRPAGSITAAQFLQRFVKDTPWAHLDVAGTAMGSPSTDISQGWASGYGVRLLDRLVRDNYEAK
ncbi:leucyl aminopeptidase [Limoniibacter endophyticus]|uniref:Probable cytosol aminopeptidase n=1 Tax=Limoniibacter endophyticus TaxID=1565040 RepID=A0A8J3GHW6_9HYPH|nr:leucyl aminopeptidase [Limoniibacter endophyticus]GHC68753.1 putative cytosol aminopeptidase [Limoniibacter endophyticus]